MEKKFSRKPLAVALGTAFAATLGASPLASADTSPFAARDLGAGYLLLADTGRRVRTGDRCRRCGQARRRQVR
jgi:hypothetical protein